MRVFILDSTLHDGTADENISFTVEDKLLIARRLDEFGVDYIDAGWPAAGADDREFFIQALELKLQHARLAASGSVRCAHNSADNDPSIKALFEAQTPVVCLSGDSWDLHVYKGLHSTGSEYLEAIADSVRFFKVLGREVIYNAEHFFDAYHANPDFAISTLTAAHTAGADVLCLCDSNGGTITSRLTEICTEIRKRFTGPLGIHAHNDADLAVANTIAAVDAGFEHVQGCMNGYGERCGCANLCSIIPNLELKDGHTTVGRENLEHLNGVAHYIADLANVDLPEANPYVGRGAFTFKGAQQVRSIFEPAGAEGHTKPEYVGNCRYIPESIPVAARRELADLIAEKQEQGYDLDGADGTAELLLRQVMQPGMRLFNVVHYEVTTRMTPPFGARTAASVVVEVEDAVLSGTATAPGPVHALDVALRESLSTVYPLLGKLKLVDYKVRMLEPHKSSAAKARVLIEWSDGERTWSTAGVSENVIDASWIALTDGLRLELLRFSEDHEITGPRTEDYSWAV